ncbi:putative MYB DNA binding protein (Tbf1) [Aspergillus clavatus NRRL 1]|uniref:MYB DNA binding protein (Tbf1), putative n=1 Tax=Aspergillus clavatus (strain ATCC 1007 / CBS 513.65 / DSM 816 / NCTC 3887 / NRRL 1 / QM 1276 / 107) TaxID=344612 RepID=A1CBA1_ASPCL|nr:MYB DNA binding protein (Tbf1), putative [Aspergillus clavatus NRRL 1]EAW13019.1 MYB DNA binding protein (Tbf1), putative [Aspergillus clavatus NRRL 1]
MADTQGSEFPSNDQVSSEVPASPALKVEDDAPSKESRPRDEDEDGSVSPRASKKRRIESESETLLLPPSTSEFTDQVPGHEIEEELSSALGAGIMDTVERQHDGQIQIVDSARNPGAPEANSDLDDMASVISSIMNHAERVEEQCAIGHQQLTAPTTTTTTPDQAAQKGLVYVKANSHLKVQSLPILDNLSTQILSLLAKSTYQDITSFVSEPESENGQAYATMRSLFDHTKKVYSSKQSFLSPTELNLTEPAQVDIIRKANLASFVSSIFGTQEIGFAELNDHFLDVFVPEGGRLLKVQGALFLELKTQAFIASMNNTERTRTELLYDLFPDDLEQRLLDRRPGTRQLAPSEADFVKRAGSRRDILLNEVNNEEAMKALPDKYHWEDFLRDLSSYITKNFDAICHQQTKKINKGRQPSSSSGDSQDPPNAPLQGQFPVATQAPEVPVDKNMHGDLVARAARAAQIALQGHGLRRSQQQSQQQQQQQQQHQQPQHQQPQPQPQHPQHQQQQQHQHQHQQVAQQPGQPQPQHQNSVQQPQQHMQQQQMPQQGSQHGQAPPGYTAAQPTGHMPPQQNLHQQHYQHSPAPPGYQQQPGQQLTFQQSPLQANFQQYNPAAPLLQGRPNGQSANHGYMPGIPHYSQSQPTQVLYERARMAASAKSSPSSRKSGLPSQRRPWTTEEENALMAGLDRVKGPHWSQILAMFGPGGTISEALKDRNQVQLKDKARNLKLFFLKSGIEVPYYLKFVTGELKTRAPAQAAKREARERQKKQGEEDKAHVEGIKGMMALAGAHSQPVALGHGHDAMSASPGLPPDAGGHSTFDQTAEQNLMQTLGQEVHGAQFGQPQHQQSNVDPSMHLGQ